MKQYIFSYGTLQKEKTQIDLFGRTLTGVSGILKGYKASSIEITDEAFLSKEEDKIQSTAISTKDENDLIKGTVLEITSEELLIADQYEPEGYIRIQVTVESGKTVWLYVHAASL